MHLREEEVAIIIAGQHIVHQHGRPRPVFTQPDLVGPLWADGPGDHNPLHQLWTLSQHRQRTQEPAKRDKNPMNWKMKRWIRADWCEREDVWLKSVTTAQIRWRNGRRREDISDRWIVTDRWMVEWMPGFVKEPGGDKECGLTGAVREKSRKQQTHEPVSKRGIKTSFSVRYLQQLWKDFQHNLPSLKINHIWWVKLLCLLVTSPLLLIHPVAKTHWLL